MRGRVVLTNPLVDLSFSIGLNGGETYGFDIEDVPASGAHRLYLRYLFPEFDIEDVPASG